MADISLNTIRIKRDHCAPQNTTNNCIASHEISAIACIHNELSCSWLNGNSSNDASRQNESLVGKRFVK